MIPVLVLETEGEFGPSVRAGFSASFPPLSAYGVGARAALQSKNLAPNRLTVSGSQDSQ